MFTGKEHFMKKPEFWQEEEKHLSETLSIIDKRIEEKTSDVEKRQTWALELKKEYMHELQSYDQVEFVDNYQKLNDLISFTEDQIMHIRQLTQIRDRPYFGRIDFLEKSDKEPMKMYIGLSSVDYDNKLYVIDWRAPVSELFYEAGKGPASYEAPDGVVEGEITLKRQYDIEQGKLLNIYNVDLNIFDEFLQHILAKTKSEQLRNIASTIQEEQNKIIRNLKDDIVIVQGYAGCGKTTIALHRIAYALYRLPDLKSSNVLLFSPNDAFLSYISKVLPELGEDNTRSATFPKFVRRFLKTDKVVESGDEFVFRYVFSAEKEQKEILSKLEYITYDKMREWLDKTSQDLKFESGFILEGENFDKESLNKRLEEFRYAKYSEKIDLIADALCRDLGVEGFDKKEIVLEQLYQRLNYPILLERLYQKFLKDFKYSASNSEEKLNFEDAVLMCVMKEMCKNILLKMDVRHIVVDEAQDYPLIFIHFLLRIFNHSTFSFFGDIYQKTVPGELNSLEDISKLEIVKGRNIFVPLDKTYRSSEEIVEYSSNLIGSPKHNAFRLKSGNPVQEITIANTCAQVAQQVMGILEQVLDEDATIGIITGDTETAKNLYNELAKVIPENKIDFIKNASSRASTQVQVLSVPLSKGLEFDSAIVIEKGKLFEHTEGNKFLFIACTRARNHLFVLRDKVEK